MWEFLGIFPFMLIVISDHRGGEGAHTPSKCITREEHDQIRGMRWGGGFDQNIILDCRRREGGLESPSKLILGNGSQNKPTFN